ncbi:MAG: hypothetical protein H6918_02630 [Sphingomonadaceae bacterium]|nr:hypothetical protein [Sphingomonadaceae bacterium]
MIENPPSVPAMGEMAQRADLRAFGWPELVARLSAAQDLRRVIRRPSVAHKASFASGAAGLGHSEGNYERAVNPKVLSDEKPDAALMSSSPDGATQGDRELHND